MSPFGHEDYGISQEREVVHAVTDLGELAARLGSINTYNRSGNVVLMDGFEEGIKKWALVYTGGNATITQSNTTARNGAYSAYLHSLITGVNSAYIWRGVGVLTQGKNGLEFSFAYPTSYNIITAYLDFYTGNYRYRGALRLDNYNADLYYINSAGTWVLLDGDAGGYADTHIFLTMKLVMDFSNLVYQRGFYNDRAYNVAGNALRQDVSSDAPHVEMIVMVENPASGSFDVYLDDVILTQNEI